MGAKKRNVKPESHEEEKSEEFLRFESALKSILSVPPEEVKRLKEDDKEKQKKKPKG